MSNKLREALDQINEICQADNKGHGDNLPNRFYQIRDIAKAALKEDGWVDKKPKADKEFVLITASWFIDHWEYTTFTVEKTTFEDNWYWGIFQDGDEWGDYDDLKADKYLILEPPTMIQTN